MNCYSNELFDPKLPPSIKGLCPKKIVQTLTKPIGKVIESVENLQNPKTISDLQSDISGLSKSKLGLSKLRPLFSRQTYQIEEFLQMATPIRVTPVNEFDRGATGAFIIKFRGKIKAVWKPWSLSRVSNYRAEVLAYEFDKLIGFNLTPPTVERKFLGIKGSLQLFIEGGGEFNDISKQDLKKQALFDYLLQNSDRHSKNYIITKGGHIVSIDHGATHTMAGRRIVTLSYVKNNLEDFLKTESGRKILSKIRSLDLKQFQSEVEEYLGKQDTRYFIGRIQNLLTTFAHL